MKKVLTGIVYVAVLVGAFCLRFYVHALFFDALILLFSVVGTFEICRAFSDRTDKVQRALVYVFSSAGIVCYALCDALFEAYGSANYALPLSAAVVLTGIASVLSLLVFRHEKTSLEGTGFALIALLYPSLFLLVLTAINHLPALGALGILFVFAICPFADCFAYVFGKLLGKKIPKKMAPNVSPNKTVIGGVGGILGGAVGALCIFFAYYGFLVPTPFAEKWGILWAYLALGVATAAFAEAGDLVESAVKRKVGIKDMGNCLPGHGGVLDRIDSSLYASVVVLFALLIRIMTAA